VEESRSKGRGWECGQGECQGSREESMLRKLIGEGNRRGGKEGKEGKGLGYGV